MYHQAGQNMVIDHQKWMLLKSKIKGALYLKIHVWNDLNNTALCVAFIFILMTAVHSAIYIKYS